MDRYGKPLHLVSESRFGKMGKGYAMLQSNSRECSDNFDIYVAVDEAKAIADAKFVGEGCVISLTSTDILLSELIGKPRAEALRILRQYLRMVYDGVRPKPPFPEMLYLFDKIHSQSSRISCAGNAALRIESFLKEA